MKTLYIFRHAEALKKDKPIPDFERPLTKKGVKHSKDVSKRLKKAGFRADLLISSPANRAIETAHIVAKGLKYPVQKILLRELLYESTNHEEFLALIRQLSNKQNSVMIFGHDPTFTALARFVAPEYAGAMPKSAILAVEFDVETWADLDPGGGKVVYYDFPMTVAERRKLEKRAKKELVSRLTDAIAFALVDATSVEVKRARKFAKNSASTLAQLYQSKSKGNSLLWRQLLQGTPTENTTDTTTNKPTIRDEVAS